MDSKESIRIAIMAGILALFFGIKQSIPDRTYETISIEFSLKFISNMFFQILLWGYIFYFLILASEYGHKNWIKPKWSNSLFDIITTATIVVVFTTITVIGTIQLMISFPNYIQAGWKTNALLIGSILVSAIFIFINLYRYYKDFTKWLLTPKNIKGNKSKDKKMDKKMKNKILFTIWIVALVLVGAYISFRLAIRFASVASIDYVSIIITTAVFLAGFGLLGMNQKDSVFFVNMKQIISWSMLSILSAFCYIIFNSSENWSNMFFVSSAFFLFLTITFVLILVRYHDNEYLNEIEKPKK